MPLPGVQTLLFFPLFIGVVVAPPPKGKESAKEEDSMYNTDGLSSKEAHEQEYYRYVTQITQELEKDENFNKLVANITEDDIKSGKFADILDRVGHNVRKRVDEVKRLEVEYQRDLIRRNKNHMADPNSAYWNPIHHENQETFEKDDLKKLLQRHSHLIEEADKTRQEEFKKHELEKEHERREAMKTLSEAEKLAKQKEHALEHKDHEKIHEPGHKAQLEEVWGEEGYDVENFNPRTFFFIHDKNGDGYLDYYEAETIFLNDLDKLYNLSDPNVDLWEREEELERMRTHMLDLMDKDQDGLISYAEFMKSSEGEDFAHDEDWKGVGENEQFFTDAEYEEYEKLLNDAEKYVENNDFDSNKEEK